MHLHGHHALVLSRNGKPATGSPWWVDTVNALPDEEYEIAFRADNPGLWMDPFRLGDGPGNHPE
jgi:FtsP/CotA-like multicopper oxidase with cupredoxin domain